MGLSQAQWYAKIKTWVPNWWFEEIENQQAVFQGLAKVLAELEVELDAHITETFICQADGDYLDEHGLERNLTRKTGESDADFCTRIRNLTNSTNCPAIKSLVDDLLEVGEATIVEDYNAAFFCDREAFLNRGHLLLDQIYNAFSIIVDKQVHAPYSFLDREYFATRENFIGRNDSAIELFELIVEAVNRAKALGVLYRVIERLE